MSFQRDDFLPFLKNLKFTWKPLLQELVLPPKFAKEPSYRLSTLGTPWFGVSFLKIGIHHNRRVKQHPTGCLSQASQKVGLLLNPWVSPELSWFPPYEGYRTLSPTSFSSAFLREGDISARDMPAWSWICQEISKLPRNFKKFKFQEIEIEKIPRILFSALSWRDFRLACLISIVPGP